jgi:putative hydrolase of the HAD superfamily
MYIIVDSDGGTVNGVARLILSAFRMLSLPKLMRGHASLPITTLFFDLYQTLVYGHPPRELRLQSVLREFGVEAEVKAIQRAYLIADDFYTAEGLTNPLHNRTAEERAAVYTLFQQRILEALECRHAPDLAGRVQQRMSQLERVLQPYPDVEPALTRLKEEGYRLGLITNVTDDPNPDLERVGLKEKFDVIAASCHVGYEKPDPRIFRWAMERLGVSPDEVVHVGDLVPADVRGAQASGIRAVLIDRWDVQEGVHSPRILDLLELPTLLRGGVL